MKTGVFWIIRIYQVDYLWVKSQANVCLRRVWKLGTLKFFKKCFYRHYLKSPRKCHGRVMEKSLNFILEFLYEPWIQLSCGFCPTFIGRLLRALVCLRQTAQCNSVMLSRCVQATRALCWERISLTGIPVGNQSDQGIIPDAVTWACVVRTCIQWKHVLCC